MEQKRVTIKEIAQAAEVSAMTVSKVINNKPGISEQTRQRVMQAVKALGYVPNYYAQSLRSSASHTLGVVLSDSSEMVTAKVLRAIEDTCEQHEYNAIVINTDHKPERERTAVRTLLGKQVDGLVFVAPLVYREQDIAGIRQHGIPFVFLMRNNNLADVDSVMNDNHLGGWSIIDHLVDMGCARFLMLLIENSKSSAEREAAMRLALESHRIAPAACRFLYTRPHIEDAAAAMRAVLDEGSFLYDAVVCGCDMQAIGAMGVLVDAGIRIPSDVCITGYDGVELASYLRVPLTTVNQPLYEIGRQGTEILLDRIKYRDMPVRKIVLKSELVCRESSMRRKRQQT